MATRLSVINGALRLLGEEPAVDLASVPANSSGRLIFAQYDEVAMEKQRMYAWSWLQAAERLSDSTEESPYDPQWIVYPLPNNILRVVTVLYRDSRRVKATYKVDSAGIHAPYYTDMTVIVTRAAPEERWTPEFSRMMQAALALEGAGKNHADLVAGIQNELESRYSKAKTTDVKASRGNTRQLFDATGVLRAENGSDFDDVDLSLSRELGYGY